MKTIKHLELRNKIEKIVFETLPEFKNCINYDNWCNVDEDDLVDYVCENIKLTENLEEDVYSVLDEVMELEIVENDGSFHEDDYYLIYVGKTEYAVL